MPRTLHWALHAAVAAALYAAGRCRRPAPFLAAVAVAGAGAGLLHAQHHAAAVNPDRNLTVGPDTHTVTGTWNGTRERTRR